MAHPRGTVAVSDHRAGRTGRSCDLRPVLKGGATHKIHWQWPLRRAALHPGWGPASSFLRYWKPGDFVLHPGWFHHRRRPSSMSGCELPSEFSPANSGPAVAWRFCPGASALGERSSPPALPESVWPTAVTRAKQVSPVWSIVGPCPSKAVHTTCASRGCACAHRCAWGRGVFNPSKWGPTHSWDLR